MVKKEVTNLIFLGILILLSGLLIVCFGKYIGATTAMTLADYPKPFIQNNQYNFIPVYGDTAMSSDVIAATDMISSLQAPLNLSSLSSSSSSSTISGSVSDDIPIGSGIADPNFIDDSLEDEDIKTFQDSTFTFKGGSYDFHDVLILGQLGTTGEPNTTFGPNIVSSLSSGENDYEDGVYMEVSKGGIGYYYVVDGTIDMDSASLSEPLQINFLGKKLKITEVSSATEFTALIGEEHNMNVGDTNTVDGKTITLDNVGSGAVIVTVDGVQETISSTSTESVNGLQITVDEVFYRTDISTSSAVLVIGTSSSEKVKDDDYYFGGDDNCLNNDPNDADCWRWNLGELTTNGVGNYYVGEASSIGPTIGVINSFSIDDDKDNPPTIGDCIPLPNNYASICLDSLNVPDSEYASYGIYYETLSLIPGLSLSENAIVVDAKGLSKGIKLVNDNLNVQDNIGTDVETNVIYISFNSTNLNNLNIAYEDKNNVVQFAGTMTPPGACTKIGEISYQDTSGNNIALCIEGTNAAANTLGLMLDILGDEGLSATNGRDDIVIGLTHSAASFSGLRNVTWGNTGKSLNDNDEDLRNMYGVIIYDPKSAMGSESLELMIPSDQVKAKVVIGSTATTNQQSSFSSDNIGGVGVAPALVKASEIKDPNSNNLILIGGPVVNSLTAQFRGANWTYLSGEAIVHLLPNGDNYALIVAGTDAADTQKAASFMKNYKLNKNDLIGTLVKI